MTITPSLCNPFDLRQGTPGRNRLHRHSLKASASCGAEQPPLTTERARNSCDFNARVRFRPLLVAQVIFRKAQVQLPKNAEISDDYKFRTKTAKYRALEKSARRERISDLSASLTVQRFAD